MLHSSFESTIYKRSPQ